tara:strand:- start:346 stop:600 length:255 start_codon:yes stop_codon:yes gene_type:complete
MSTSNIISVTTDEDLLTEVVTRFDLVRVERERANVDCLPEAKESCPMYTKTKRVHFCDDCSHLVGLVEYDLIACAYKRNIERLV